MSEETQELIENLFEFLVKNANTELSERLQYQSQKKMQPIESLANNEKTNEEKQEQETEKVEVKQEQEAGKNDATDDIVSKIKKLKELLEEGILTEEEYQKKKDELVSQI